MATTDWLMPTVTFGVEGSVTFTAGDANNTQVIKVCVSARVKPVHVLCTMCITCTVYNVYEHVFVCFYGIHT